MVRCVLSHAGLLMLGLLFGAGAEAEAEAIGAAPTASVLGHDVFRVPGLAGGLRRFRTFLERGDRAAAADLLDRLSAEYAEAGMLRTAREQLLDEEYAVKADPGALRSLAALSAPVGVTCPTAGPTAEPAAARVEIEPALVSNNEAPVAAGNTTWNSHVQRLVSEFAFPPILARKPISPQAAPAERGGIPAGVLRPLQSWYARGRAAGLAGVLYDNRDRGHSQLPAGIWPQLAFTRYSEAARAAHLDQGLNTDLLFGAVTFGNSSTAITAGQFWRSQARLALTSPAGPERLFQLYAHDHLYVFPEHRDHDPAETGGRGDIFPANTPYYLVSQGSSGSDKPFLVAVATILAAMKPEVRDFLDRHDLVAPTVQMVFRSALEGVTGPEEYMSPRAHPTAFRAEDIDLARMIDIAQALEADTVPPMPCLEAVRQTHPVPRIGYFADGLSELLFDTPSAIARAWRGSDAERLLRVSTGQTTDPNGRDLAFHWRILRGDPERVRINPLNEAGSEVEIALEWHERGEVPGRPELTTDRVDIAVFADNGVTLSAPAFVSMLFPADQLRSYETLPDGTERVLAIDYADPERRKRYSDPALFPRRDWRDRYVYDEQNRLIGWTRERAGAPDESFTRHGLRVLSRDTLRRPERAEEIAYPARTGKNGVPEVTPTPTGRAFGYVYAGESDRLGAPVPAAAISPD